MYDIAVLILVSLFGVWFINRYQRLPATNDLIPESRRNRRIVNLWLLAQKSMREGDALMAEKALLTILSLDNKNATAYNRIGILYAKQKEYGDALECFTAACSIDKNASSLHNLGLVYYNLEQYEKAAIAFKQSLELDSQSAIRYIEYAKVLECLGRDKEVIDALEKAASLEPTVETLQLLQQTYTVRRMHAQAEAVGEKLKYLITPSAQPRLQRS